MPCKIVVLIIVSGNDIIGLVAVVPVVGPGCTIVVAPVVGPIVPVVSCPCGVVLRGTVALLLPSCRVVLRQGPLVARHHRDGAQEEDEESYGPQVGFHILDILKGFLGLSGP